MLSANDKRNEIIRCGRDPKYFIKRYVFIQHPTKGRIKFTTYPYQDDVVDALENHRHNIVLKSRQLGLSTIAAAYSLWMAVFHKDKNIIVIATKLETAQNFVKKVKIALLSLPPWLVLPKHDDKATALNFDNGSRVIAIPASDDAGRSEAISLLIVDECAFIRNFDTLWTGLSPTISTGGNAFILSSPNGVGGQFYKLWIGAEAGQNNFNPIKLPWTVHPEHDEKWFKEETKDLTRKKVAQEYMCDFLASGDTFLQVEDLDWMKSKVREPLLKTGFDRNVWIWAHPESEKRYVISADIARGDSQDFSAFHVIDADDGQLVAEYMGKAPPEVMGQLMDEYGRKYNIALAIPENNTFGYMTAMYLKANGYPRMYYKDHKGDPFNFVPTDDMLPGFSTQTHSRRNILTKFEELIRNKMINCPSSRLVQQLQAFVWQNAKAQALKDSHDDLIISIAIGMYVVGGELQQDCSRTDLTVALLNATSRMSRSADELPGLRDLPPPMNPQMITTTFQQVRSGERGRQLVQTLHPMYNWLVDK